MTSHHNLRTVFTFELHRTVVKRRFWVATLIVPVLIVTVFSLSYVSNRSAHRAQSAQRHASFSFAYTDASGVINESIATRLGGVRISSTSAGIAAVKHDRIAAFFAYPAKPAIEPIKVYGADVGVFNNGKYAAVATQLLTASAAATLATPVIGVYVRGAVHVTTTTYVNGVASPGLNGLIAPLLYLLVFYLLIALLGNQMLTSTVEEKENRVTEMILTTVDARTLIVGKILSLFSAGVLQMLVFTIPVVIGYAVAGSALSLPSIDVSSLVFALRPMVIGALLLLGGFTLFTGTLITIGAMMPTARDAGGFFGAVLGAIFIPFYALRLIMSHPNALIVQVFTYFPFTAPVTDLLRNAFGSLSTLTAAAVLTELFVIGAVVIRLAIRLFQFGSIEYTRKLSITTAVALLRRER